MKLVYKETGVEVKLGDVVAIDGVTCAIESCPKPHKPESSGRVYLNNGASYYVSVIGAEWVEREDRDVNAAQVV